MREIITLHLGQCGNQLGLNVSNQSLNHPNFPKITEKLNFPPVLGINIR